MPTLGFVVIFGIYLLTPHSTKHTLKEEKNLLKPHFWNVIDLYLIINFKCRKKRQNVMQQKLISSSLWVKNFVYAIRQSFMIQLFNLNYSHFSTKLLFTQNRYSNWIKSIKFMRKYVMTEMKYIFTILLEKYVIKETKHVLYIQEFF